MSLTTPYFEYQYDDFNGITINILNAVTSTEDFKQALTHLLEQASIDSKQLIWISIPHSHAVYIPITTELGFVFHNCLSDEITLTLTLKENVYIPFIPSYTIGAGAIVINDKQEVLVINERIEKQSAYKLPGGHVELTEKISEAIVREVFEETGVRAKFTSILGLTSKHPYRFGKSNMYFICKLEPLTEKIDIQDTDEIEDAKWVPIDEYIEDESHHAFNRNMVNQLANKTGLEYLDVNKEGDRHPKLETFFSRL